jgi:hypothetical protein
VTFATHCRGTIERYARGPWRDVALAFASFVGALYLYVYTLAPTITWGDDVTLTVAALRGELRASAGSHPAWTALAHLMAQLPLGEPAFRVNLTSALAAATTLTLMYLVFQQLDISRIGAVTGCVALAVSHTFWAHAVRAEVYTLTLAALAFVQWTALKWWRTRAFRYLALVGLAVGLAFTTHVLTLLYLPALAWLVFRSQPGKRGLVVLAASTVAALAPYGWLLLRDSSVLDTDVVGILRWALLTFEGYDFSGQMFRFTWETLSHDTILWLAYLAFQFVGVGLILLAIGAVSCWRRWSRDIALFVGLLYLPVTAFAFAYDVGDRYVFYLPSYLACVAWLALGADVTRSWLNNRIGSAHRRALIAATLLILICVAPVITYRYTPAVLQRMGVQIGDGRYVPGPNSRYFLLWPPKRGYYDARDFAESTLLHAPADALILADPVLASPIQYLLRIETKRPDVVVRFCCWDIDSVLSQFPNRPVALVDVAPEIYPIERLQREYYILPHGPLYLLQPRP